MVSQRNTDTIVTSFAKAGPWALLSLILMSAVGWKANQLIDTYMSYVSESKVLMVKLSESTVERDKVHASQLKSLDVLQEALTLRANEHLHHEAVMQEILTLMQEAKVMMQEVPQQREEQLSLLKRIDDGIQQLTILLQRSQEATEQPD